MELGLIVLLISVTVIIVVMGFSVFLGAPYVPTRRKWAISALKLAKIDYKDVVVDLGSGDGAVLKLIADSGARAIGYEINPILYLVSRLRTAKYGARVRVNLKNYWSESLPLETTTIYAFCVERDALKLENYLKRQSIKHLKVVTFGFDLPNIKPIASTRSAKFYII